MKITHLLIATDLAIVIPASVQAADAAKKEERKAAAGLISQYDKNSNGSIDGDEVDAIKKAYEADKSGPLKKFDTNNDGKLDDSEIAAIKGGKKRDKKAK